MKIVNKKPLSQIKEERENKEGVVFSINALGQQLVQEKLEHAQTKELVNVIGQELAQAELRITALEGGNAK